MDCSVCGRRIPATPEDECDGAMDDCHNVCPRFHIEDFKDGLTLCTSCFLWLMGAYNDILAGRAVDRPAVRYLRLMVLDQRPLLTDRVRSVLRGSRLAAPPFARPT